MDSPSDSDEDSQEGQYFFYIPGKDGFLIDQEVEAGDSDGDHLSLISDRRRNTILQRRTTITDDNGFMYTINRTSGQMRYLRCTRYRKGCQARAILRVGGRVETQPAHPHNHPVDPHRVAVRKFTQAFIIEAEDRRGRKLMEIYQQVVSRYPELASHVPYRAAFRALKRDEVRRAKVALALLCEPRTPKIPRKAKPKVPPKKRNKLAYVKQRWNAKSEAALAAERVALSLCEEPPIEWQNTSTSEPADEERGMCESEYELATKSFISMSDFQEHSTEEPKEEYNYEVEVKEEYDEDGVDYLAAASDDNEPSLPESELLPGPKGQPMYYDGVGYYYDQLNEDNTHRWLQCSHSGCGASAHMGLYPGAPITLLETSEGHNHQPNQSRRERIFFLHSIKTRHATEETPFSVIFHQEAERNPVGASFFSFEKIEKHLKKKMAQTETEPEAVVSVETPSPSRVVPGVKKRGRPTLIQQMEAKRLRLDTSPQQPQRLTDKLALLKSLQGTPPPQITSMKPETKPSQRLPGPYPHSFLYHDGNGYYYKALSISVNTRYLVCTTAHCSARAAMSLEENAPISLERGSRSHNHPPETTKEDVSMKRTARKKTGSVRPIQTSVDVPEETSTTTANNLEMSDDEDAPVTVKRSQKLVGPEFFHDFKGNYYYSTQVKGQTRYLHCLAPTCQAKATMALEDNAEIIPDSKSRPHNHKPDLKTDCNSKISQWDGLWRECLPSERLPSLRLQYCCYHDGRGFYYHQTTQRDNIRFLTCAKETCPVRGHMCTKKDSPITVTPLRPNHNHGADISLRDALLFVDAVRVRVRSDTLPVTAIALESVRNPVGAERVDLKILQHCLQTALEISKSGSNKGMSEDEVDFESCIKQTESASPGPSTNSYQPVDNHFSTPWPVAAHNPKNLEEMLSKKEKLKSEKVPALLSDTWLHHDGRGFYYKNLGIHQDRRFLKCVVTKCGVRASMMLEPRAHIKVHRQHNHSPQPPEHRLELWFFYKIKVRMQEEDGKTFEEIYREEAEKNPEGAKLVSQEEASKLLQKLVFSDGRDEPEPDRILTNPSYIRVGERKEGDAVHITSDVPSEKLPCISFNRGWMYHDGQGYYYHLSKLDRNKMYMKCINRNNCNARASKPADDGAPITLTMRHTHDPDPLFREESLFSYTVMCRARDENTPIRTIYEEEIKRYPELSSEQLETRMINKLHKLRHKARQQLDVAAEGDDQEEDMSSEQLRLVSEVLPGRYKPVYHDDRGHFFLETFSTDHFRYLMCVESQCLAQAKMLQVEGAAVVPQVGSPSHSHAPDPLRRHCLLLMHNLRTSVRSQLDQDIEDIYDQETTKEPFVATQIPKVSLMKILKNIRLAEERGIDTRNSQNEDENQVEEEELWVLDVPAERLPCQNGEGWVYHDGRGYYYYCHHTHQDRRSLRCCEEGCEAAGWLDNTPNATVTRAHGSVLHNHSPDLSHRTVLLFLHRISSKVLHEHCPITTVYHHEAMLDPEGASLVSKNKIKSLLNKLMISKYFKVVDSDDDTGVEEKSDEDIYNDEEGSVEPCERLHSANTGQQVYHDNKGYYYRDLRQTYNKQYLVCLTPMCKARAYILLSEPSEIHLPALSPEHCHQADCYYRNKLLFVHNLRQRVLSEDTPVNVIYNEEANREPIGADIANSVAIKNLMYKLRKSRNIQENSDDEYTEEPDEDLGENESLCSDDIDMNVEDDDKNKTDGKGNTNNDFGDSEGWDEEYTEEEYLDEEKPESSKESQGKGVKQGDVAQTSEKLPSRSSKVLYHDGKGYYFHFNTLKEKVMYLRCAEPRCKVRGWKSTATDDSPIIPTKDSPVHSHQPNFTRRKQLLFVHRCKVRAASENLTLNEILESEAFRDPETANQISAVNVKTQMKRYRLEHASYPPKTSVSSSTTQICEQTAEDGITFQDASVTDFDKGDNVPAGAFTQQDIHQGAVPEKIPSLNNESLWHAAGFFYNTCGFVGDLLKGKCTEKGCNARVQIKLPEGTAPVIRLNKNTSHNHEPDLRRRDQLLFIDRCKRRAADSFEAIEDIFDDEAAKEPIVAAQLSSVRVKRAMIWAKKVHLKTGKGVEMEEGVEEDMSLSECLLNQDDGSLVYHDGRGHFYTETRLLNSYRMLKCLDCSVQAKMSLTPPNAAITVLGHHTHTPDLNRIDHFGAELRPIKTEPGSLMPRHERPGRRYTIGEEDSLHKDDSENVDQRYSDFVTLEDDGDYYDEEALNMDDDPDFEPSPKKSEDSPKSFHDGNGYYYSLAKERNKRYLKCKAAGCEVRVPLGPRDKPLLKLFSTSPVHGHAPDLLRRKQNLFLKKAARSNDDVHEEDESEMEEEYKYSESQGDDILEEVDSRKNTKPSMLVHSQESNCLVYYDGNGYYFNSLHLTDRYRYLACELNSCEALGFLERYVEDAPINLTRHSPEHNHLPEPSFKDFNYFVEKCKSRAVEEDTPIREIFKEESALDPVSASKIPTDSFVQRLLRMRRGHLSSTQSAPSSQVFLQSFGNKKEDKSKTASNPSKSDLDEDMGDYDFDSHENENDECNESERSETLPGFRPNSTIFHDGKGYYFIFNAQKEHKRYLRCIEPRCRVRASMSFEEGAPIRPTSNNVHNHRPDFRRKNFVLFLQRCKTRAADEPEANIQDIYNEEALRDPVSAAMISSHNLTQRMCRARKINTRYFPTDEDQTEFELACSSSTPPPPSQIPASEMVDEDSRSQDEAYHNIVAEAVTDDDEVNDEVDLENEAIEKAISKLTNETDVIKSEKEVVEGGAVTAEGQLASETLPGLRPNSVIYYDGRGYYYLFNTHKGHGWYLRCIEPKCRVRAHMRPEDGAPIFQSPNTVHNHRPDYKRRRLLLWMERAKQRALTEELPIPTIYAQEAASDPEIASLIPADNMKTRMYRARKAFNKQISETEKTNGEQTSSDVQPGKEQAKGILKLKKESTLKEKIAENQKKNPLSNVLTALVNYLSPNNEAVVKSVDQSGDENQTVVMVADSQSDDSEAVITIQAEGAEDGSTVYLYQQSNMTPQRPTFCDDKGYCYQQTTIRQSVRYLRCIEKGCKARANMGLEENATITFNKQYSHHNHDPDHSQYTMLLDSSQMDTPIQVIYTDEDGGEQVALCHISDKPPTPAKRPYRQRQKPELTIDPEELFDAKNVNEVDVAGGDYYHTEDQQKYPLKPSEVIPGLRPDANNYHDGNGFYYELNRLSQNIRYLKCLIKDCRARAYMEVGKENAPIIQTNFAKHNHGPDLFRKQFTVFLHRVTRRAAEEDTPINLIYQQESERDPHSASQIRMENVKQRMMRFRKKHRQNRSLTYNHETGADEDLDGSVYHFLVEGDMDEDDGSITEYYIRKEDDEEAEDKGSMYQGYVVSEVEVESSQQQQG